MSKEIEHKLYLKTVLYSAVFWFLCLSSPPAFPQDAINAVAADSIPSDRDTAFNILPDLEVRDSGRSPFRKKNDGSVELKGRDVERITRTLGEADFINQIKGLANVNSSSDYASGLSVDGSDFTQSQYLIDGVPVTFPYRFGGIFSVFNPSFFTSMRFLRQSPASVAPRLGAALLFRSPSDFSTHISGDINVGLLASSLTVHGGAAGKVSFSVGGRISYVNQAYGRWLNKPGNALDFSFNDINAALSYRIASEDIVKASFFQSDDKVGYADKNYSIDTRLHWTNRTLSLSYNHLSPLSYSIQVYRTFFKNVLRLDMPQFNLTGPSSLTSFGGRFAIGRHPERGIVSEWEAGAIADHYEAFPQSAEMAMSIPFGGESGYRHSKPIRQRMFAPTAFGSMTIPIVKEKLISSLEGAIGYFSSNTAGEHYHKIYFTPRIKLRYLLPEGEVALLAGMEAQPLHQVGFSELGLASNFWIGSCAKAPLQRSQTISVNIDRRLPWLGLSAEAGLYWKNLRNQAEYQGEVLEVIDTDYDPFSKLIISDGYNYGFFLGIHRTIGPLTGEASYSYAEGKRHLPDQPRIKWNALNGDGHTVKASLLWQIGSHWTLSSAFRFSSGRRYTPVKSLYVIGNNIAMEFGERNSARLPSYQRLDLGATYSFATGGKLRLRHLINLSLLNAYGHRNVEMQYFILNTEKGTYTLKRLNSLYRFLPSVSYSVEF